MSTHEPNTAPPPKLLVDSKTAADMLSISERTLWTIRNAGEIPFVRRAGKVLYDPRDLMSWIDRNKTTEPKPSEQGEQNVLVIK